MQNFETKDAISQFDTFKNLYTINLWHQRHPFFLRTYFLRRMLCKYNHSVLHLVSRSFHAVLHTSKLQKCWTLRFIDGFIGLCDFLSCADGGRVCPVQVVRECALDSLWEAAGNQRPEPGHSEAANAKSRKMQTAEPCYTTLRCVPY